MNKSINVEVTTQEQRDQLIKQLQEMSFDREVKSWEDYLNTIYSEHAVGIIQDTIALISNAGEHYKALYKLEKLKEYYNDGWEPNWTDDYYKYIITFSEESITKPQYIYSRFFLAFKTEEIRNKFLNNHRDLIETAKCLL